MRVWKSSDPMLQSSTEQLWCYNALDCCVTLEVLNHIKPQLDEITRPTYEFAMALAAPVLEMEARGVLIDLDQRAAVIKLFTDRYNAIEEDLNLIFKEGLECEINWNSPAQLKTLFYETMGLPIQRDKGKPTTKRTALEKLRNYFYAEPLVTRILALRDLQKSLSFLKSGLDSDGRIRTTINVAGTKNGRVASHESAFDSGNNLQNVTAELRQICVADLGYKLCYMDLEQAEARVVGAIIWNLFNDSIYLDSCESGDLHTLVSKLCWTQLSWTGDPKQDRKLADGSFYRHFSYRDAAKRLGHGSNYYGKPPHISAETRIPVQLIADFQPAYFKAFPGISKWHSWVRQKLLKDGWITSLLGRRRQFMGRRWEAETLRSAIAFEPQSVVADLVGRGILRIWRKNLPYVQLLMHATDALVFQYREERPEAVLEVKALFEEELPIMNGRSMLIPSEPKVGWNWSYQSDSNPDGLIKFGNDTRKRQNNPAASFLDRRFY